MSMSFDQRTVHLGFTEERFPASTHMCYIFSDEDERRQIITRFLKSGFEGREKLGYFAERISKDELCSCLEDMGVDTEVLTRSGQLYVDQAETVYCPDQCFCSHRMIDNLCRFYNSAIESGYAGFRVSGEMDWVLKSDDRTQELLLYEARVNEVVEAHPVTAICQYDANKFDGALLHQVLEVHPYMVVRGQVVRNPYYVVSNELQV